MFKSSKIFLLNLNAKGTKRELLVLFTKRVFNFEKLAKVL